MPKLRPLEDPDIDILIPKEVVDLRIRAMATTLVERYSDVDPKPLFVCLMDGGQPFNNALLAAINQINPDFHPDSTSMIVSRYGTSHTAGETNLVAPIPRDKQVTLPGRRVIFVDDLIDQGGTMQFAINYALHNGAASARAEVLARKLKHPQIDVTVEDIGFDGLPNEWLVGRGMDNLGKYRWSGYIAVYKPGLVVDEFETATDLPAGLDAVLDPVAG